MARQNPVNRLVVVGASLAGIRAVEAARREGFSGTIDLIGRESHPPYDRPPLSKSFLYEPPDEPVFHASLERLGELDVTVYLGVAARGLDVVSRRVIAGSHNVDYDKLIIATGAEPRRLPLRAGYVGVETLRTLSDARRIKSLLWKAQRVVIVGAGVIGAEVASSAVTLGKDVTLVESADVPLVRAFGHHIGRAISELHERHGARLITGTTVAGAMCENGEIRGLELSSGAMLAADLVVVGIGALPATGWLRESGVALHAADQSLQCDAYLCTSDPNVFAAGDVVRWHNELSQSHIRLENWTNAAEQGERAVLNALFPERAQPFVSVPYFWTDWYGSRIQFVGDAETDDVIFAQGGPGEDKFVALYRRGAQLVGAATLNEPRRIMKLRRIIADHGSWRDAMQLLAQVRTSAGTPQGVNTQEVS